MQYTTPRERVPDSLLEARLEPSLENRLVEHSRGERKGGHLMYNTNTSF